MSKDAGRISMDDPLGFFLTWTTYGTWLPGDERGWVAKPGRFRQPDAKLKAGAARLLTEPFCTLDEGQRCVVENTIAEHCTIRSWYLHKVSCRTNHVHVVVTAPGRDPEEVMDQFKAWCTRRLKELERSRHEDATAIRQNWWTQRGSKRWLNDEASLEEAIRYVAEGQTDGRFLR
jgi:REP element-mobilizing transposase RayT